MKKIKVHLQYPWKFPDSSYYKNILENPPKKITYTNYQTSSLKKMSIIGSSKKFELMRRLKNVLRKVLNFLSLPNLTLTLGNNYDLIHCAHCLSTNRKPWVVDTETFDKMTAGGNIAYSKIGKWIIKSRLESKYCKKIIAWSKDCKKTFEEAFPGNKKILNKIEIVHFSLPPQNIKKIQHKKIRILFVARWFDAKGGRQTLEVFDKLSKKYSQVEFLFICPTPREIKKKYSKNSKIKIMDLVPQEKLFKEIYPRSDIFFYPGFGDSYGFAVPEAMAYGLPIITTDTFAKKEIVGGAGFLVNMPRNWRGYHDMNEKLLEDLEEKTSVLIRDESLRKKMGRIGRREVESGKFSIEKRNSILRKIYSKVLETR